MLDERDWPPVPDISKDVGTLHCLLSILCLAICRFSFCVQNTTDGWLNSESDTARGGGGGVNQSERPDLRRWLEPGWIASLTPLVFRFVEVVVVGARMDWKGCEIACSECECELAFVRTACLQTHKERFWGQEWKWQQCMLGLNYKHFPQTHIVYDLQSWGGSVAPPLKLVCGFLCYPLKVVCGFLCYPLKVVWVSVLSVKGGLWVYVLSVLWSVIIDLGFSANPLQVICNQRPGLLC